jgi:hypothetical protein
LQQILRAAGYVKGSGVSSSGITLVTRLARQHRLRDWSATRTLADYDALLQIVRDHLAQAGHHQPPQP